MSYKGDIMRKSTKIFITAIICSIVFAGAIYFLDFMASDVALLPDQGAAWYYWKLPNPNILTRLSAWVPYLVHQVVVWYLLYKITQMPASIELNKYNYMLLGTNFIFILLHFVQTYTLYDGLAQDTPVFSSQGSVIIMLVMILIMENRRRGLFFGLKVPMFKDSTRRVMKVHGFIFSWAIVYTFWFHPMVGTAGHVAGFFYMFLLFIQLSMAKTRLHFNKYWTLTLEVFVLIHGATVAYIGGSPIWTMFAFGFGFLFIVTQLYGLGLTKIYNIGITVGYILLTLWIYSPLGFAGKSFSDINEIIRIPIIEYILVFVFILIFQTPSIVKKIIKSDSNKKIEKTMAKK